MFCLLWGIMTLFLFIGTLKGRRSLQFVFLTLTVTFFLLAAGDIGGSHTLVNFGGFVGIICGLSAMYTAFAEVIAEQHGKELLPF
jgi:succinate-acetate transporter protein